MRYQSKPRLATVAVQVALCLVPLMGVAAIAMDGGVLLDQRRRVQAAADAAALAAAADLYTKYQTDHGHDTSGTALASALSTAAANGYNNDGVTSTVTVHIPPASGIAVNQPGCAEVIVQYNQPRFFSTIFGSGTTPVSARAVARGRAAPFKIGVLVLNPTQSGASTAHGNGDVTVKGASFNVNSNNSQGNTVAGSSNLVVTDTGQPSPLTAMAGAGSTTNPSAFNHAGVPGYVTMENGKLTGPINSGVTPTPDPLHHLPQVDPSTLPVQSNYALQISSDTTLNPGVYQGGIQITGTGNVTLNPGTYYMAGGGLSYTGSGSVTGNGVLIYNAPVTSSDTININGTGNVTLSPLTSGVRQGITIFQDRTSTAPINITGNGHLQIKGTFYAAHGTVSITAAATATGTDVIGSQYITYNLSLINHKIFNINWDDNPSANGRTLTLVE